MYSPPFSMDRLLLLFSFILASAFFFITLATSSISPKNISATGFVAPLIHRTSPLSPFYDPNKTPTDIVAENLRLTEARYKYFSQVHAIANNDTQPMLAVAPVSHDFVMTYFIGTPRVLTLAIPDTGSGLIWLQCSPCDSCYKQIGSLYSRTKSSSYRPIDCRDLECRSEPHAFCGLDGFSCRYSMNYIKGPESHGNLAKETFSLPMHDGSDNFVTLEDALFGCGTRNIDNVGDGIPGVVGLQNSSSSLVRQLKGPKRFSYCHKAGTSGGYIGFGSEARLLGRGKTPLISNRFGTYHVILEGIEVNFEEVDMPSDIFKMRGDVHYETGVIIDSGASHTFLRSDAYDDLVNEIKAALSNYASTNIGEWELCYSPEDLSPTRYNSLLQITFNFKDLSIDLRMSNAWFLDEDRNLCLAILRFKDFQFSVIGMYQQNSFNVGFDVEENSLYMQYQTNCPEF